MVVLTSRRRLLAIGLVLALVLAVLLVNKEQTLWPVSGTNKLKPIYRVDTEEKLVALTFDACWGSSYTKDILRVLGENQAESTFFLVNIWLEDYPELAKEIRFAGHEIGLHSTTHPHFPQLSEEAMAEELSDNARMIRQVTGYNPVLFRPPFGDYDDRVIRTVSAAGFIPIQWDVDSLDWKGLSAREITERVLSGVQPGSIVLFHNDGEHTAEALPGIISALKERGYTMVSVSKLLWPANYYVDINGVQHKGSE